jgi:putative restriction endonuclease
MYGYVAVTHHRWYAHLAARWFWDEVNFWRPSAHHGFNGPPGSPFFFKLKAPHNAIGGFGLVARFSRLPEWLAWECFGEGNGAATFAEMAARLKEIRARNNFTDAGPVPQIGCILLSDAVFFPPDLWVAQPSDWSPRNLTYQRYDLEAGEGLRIWRECQERVAQLKAYVRTFPASVSLQAVYERLGDGERYGTARLVVPRLGQGLFRVAVTDAYGRACAVTGEHSLPVLEAAHIMPFSVDGPHDVSNGLLLRADIHRLFDQGYLTVTPEQRLEVSQRLKQDYENGRTYYPYHGATVAAPTGDAAPSRKFLAWHNENVYRG